MTRRSWWLAAVAAMVSVLALLAAGCASSTIPGSGSATGSGGGQGGADGCGSSEPGACVTFTATGAASVKGTFHTGLPASSLLESCAEWVKGENGKLTLPTALGQSVGGHEIVIANRISKYTGPGSYQKAALGAIDGGVHVDIDSSSYQTSDGSDVKAEIRSDGSGSFTYTNLREATNSSDTSPKGTISGNYEWTCQGG